MSFAFASYNQFGIVISADRRLTGTTSSHEKYVISDSCQKLLISKQGYAVAFVGEALVDGAPVPIKMQEAIEQLDADMCLKDFFQSFMNEMPECPEGDITFIGAGYEDGTPHIYTATAKTPGIILKGDTCYTGATDIGKTLICAVPTDYRSMSLQTRIDFHRFITEAISKLQRFGAVRQTVSADCDVVAIDRHGVCFNDFHVLC